MLSEAQSIADFYHRGIVRGGELYLSVPEALAFLDVCREQDLTVVGVEGFVLEEEKLKPQQEAIADGSSIEASTWPEFQEKSNRFAEAFLHALKACPGLSLPRTPIRGSGGRPELVVNLTTLSEEEWKGMLQKGVA